jgi:hypothetical protein
MIQYGRIEIMEKLDAYFKDVCTVYPTDRPSSTNTQKDRFVVIDVGDMDDKGAYQESYVELKVFMKDRNNMEDTYALDSLQKSLLAKFPLNNELFYSERPQLLKSRSDGSGFHYLTIYFDITIK